VNHSSWQDKPTEHGRYWMRWRRKWGRIWSYDIIHSNGTGVDIRILGNWRSVGEFNRASFYGPLNPPIIDEIDRESAAFRAAASPPRVGAAGRGAEG
jgi:hypothetical protein